MPVPRDMNSTDSNSYKRLKSFQIAQLVYDITAEFVEQYVDSKSRTCDQMIQAARSGVQNIAEGSVDFFTSSSMEINLYNVARASLVELSLDYEDFLRQRSEELWGIFHPLRVEFVKRCIGNMEEYCNFLAWAKTISPNIQKPTVEANCAVLLINVATYFLKRQIESKLAQFKNDGDFSDFMRKLKRKR